MRPASPKYTSSASFEQSVTPKALTLFVRDESRAQSEQYALRDAFDFLNLTTVSLSTFKQAYCINLPEGDNCPFGYCPNPDVAGKLPLSSTLHFIFMLNLRGDYLRSPRPYSRYILALTLRISSG